LTFEESFTAVHHFDPESKGHSLVRDHHGSKKSIGNGFMMILIDYLPLSGDYAKLISEVRDAVKKNKIGTN
jgi:hypothetical protein